MEDDVDKQSRVLLRPWLENMLASGKIHGLVWHDPEKTMFRIPWKHRSKKDWSIEHCSVFVEWAKNTGRLSDGSKTPNFAQLKTRLRCAFNKAPDIEEMRELHFNYGEEPYKVYRFRNRKDVAFLKTKHKVPLPSSSRHLSKKSAEAENFKKFENSLGDNIFTDNSNEGLIDERSFVINKHKEKNMSTEGAETEMLSNSYNRKTWPDGDPWKADVATRPELNKMSTDTPFIPLSVEMFAASSSSDSDSNQSSPIDPNTFELPEKKSFSNSYKDQTKPDQCHHEDFNNTTSSHRREFEGPNEPPFFRSSSEVIDNESCATSSNLDASQEQLSSKEHMLQVASLFVEAGEKITQQAFSSSASRLPLQTTGPLESDSFTVISPRKDVHHKTVQELYYEGHESPQKSCDADRCVKRVKYGDTVYGELLEPGTDAVDLTYKSYLQDYNEPIDLTKTTFATQFTPKPSQSHRFCPELWKHTNEETLNEEIVNAVLRDIDSEGIDFLPTDSIEGIRMKAKHGEEVLVSKAKLLCQWENRLMRWETELQATEAACYWKNKLLDMELAKNCIPVQNDQHRIGITRGSNQQNSTRVVRDSTEVAARLILPGNDRCPQVGLGLQSNMDVRVLPEAAQTFPRNNASTVSIRQLNNGSSFSSGNSIASVINRTNLLPSKRERSNYRKQCKAMVNKSLSETNKKTNALPEKKLHVCSLDETCRPRFSLQIPTAITDNQPSLRNFPSVICKVDFDNNLLCAKTDTFCKEEVSVEDPVDKSKSISDSEVLVCARLVPQTTNEPFFSSSTPSISEPLLPSVGRVSPVPVINSPVDESFDLKESRHRSAGFQRIDCAHIPSGTVFQDGQDSDCESGLVIETSDEEEKLIEEDRKMQTHSKNWTIRRCSDQENSTIEAQKPMICNKRTIEAENFSVEKRLVPMLNNTESANAGSMPDVPCSFVSSNSQVFVPSPRNSGNRSPAGHRLEEFTEWLRKKTQMLCKEASESSTNIVPLLDSVQVHEEDYCCTGNSPVTRKRMSSTTNEEEQNTNRSSPYKISCNDTLNLR